ncbi:NAD-dependent epimerase/dehydratase family protein [Alkalihalobacterium chitinilyticum]|uniref:NAD(P)-dependent oxidoreductase n=1 Tax=Alkalihalobacterium chitinilyticum TaxID=2980103 RepID=A0ABT5VK67_9BACI|nr:NAD(P)-dependent oxidoreductase [Alkalihalobacterium chitinilyticum]MDE5415841.1 NAD(P)-dependent oxidoreductase [Alkalihalobacterium chitinilyticum]
MMKIAITGGTGFLGEYVVESIKKENQNPIILSRKEIGEIEVDCEARFTDYSKLDLLEKLSDIEAVVHLAAKRGSQGKISEFHDNEVMTQNLYEACLELNISNVVYASTISIYSNEDWLPWKEIQVPIPELMYGVSKLANEHIGNIYSRKKGMSIKNLRFAHLYGFNEKNNYMINRFFRQAYHREQIVLNTRSVAKREFLYVKDAAKAVVYALKHPSLSGTFNIGSGEAYTNYEVAEAINTVFGNDNNIMIKDHTAEEGIHSSYMDSMLAEKYLYFTPDYSFSDALSEIYKLMRGLDDVPLWY